MHILFISDGDSKYGASQSMKQLVQELLKLRTDIEISVVLPLRCNLIDDYRRLGCNVYKILYEPFYQGIPEQEWKLPVKFIIRGIEYLIGKWTGIFFLSKKLNMDDIDLIHSNSSREDFGAALALKYKKPLIWHIREFGDKDYNCFSFRKDYLELMDKAAIEFIAVSEAVRKHWIKKGIQEQKIVRIYNGVIAETGADRKNIKERNGKLRLLMTGSLCETKGQHQIVEAIGLLEEKEKENIMLDLVGGGCKSYIRKLNDMIEKYSLSSSVHFLGYQKNFGQKMCQYDCGIICSKSEGFGRVTIEYMMAGLPVIASDTGANTELVIKDENGLLYKWNDVLDLKEKIRYFLHNTEAMRKMGEKAKTYAQTHFSAKQNAELIYNEYLKITK